jgi:hypothetical protein
MDYLMNFSRTINVDMSSMSGIREGIAAAAAVNNSYGS